MGAGKSTLGASSLAESSGGRSSTSTREIERDEPIARIFETGGEAAFRLRESKHALDALRSSDARRDRARAAARSGPTRSASALRERALTVLVEVDAEEAWRRVARQRPAAGAGRGGLPDALRRAAAALRRRRGRAHQRRRRRRARRRRRPRRDSARSSGSASSFPATARSSSSATRASPGSTAWTRSSRSERGLARATSCRRASRRRPSSRWRRSGSALRLERGGTLVALGGGCTTDVAGFAAATLPARGRLGRGADDARRPGRRRDRRQDGDRPARTAKNLVGAFHWPVRTVIDPATARDAAGGRARERTRRGREDRPARRRAALGAARSPSRCAAAPRSRRPLCLRDPHDRGERAQLNLGHTFAHALEAAAGFELPHGRAVALGLLAALRLSGLDTAAGRARAPPGAGAGRPRARRGRRSHATRRSSTACRGSSCSRRPAGRCSASSCPRPRCERRSTR